MGAGRNFTFIYYISLVTEIIEEIDHPPYVHKKFQS